MTEKEALKIALEALERVNTVDDDCDILSPSLAEAVLEAIDFAKEALAQPEQEPVKMYDGRLTRYHDGSIGIGTPPQRPSRSDIKPLTDEEIRYALESEFLGSDEKRNWQDDLRVARAIEAAHGIKELA